MHTQKSLNDEENKERKLVSIRKCNHPPPPFRTTGTRNINNAQDNGSFFNSRVLPSFNFSLSKVVPEV
jgi:hypothetical protein